MKKIYQLVLKSYLGPLVLTFFIIIFILMMNFVWRYIDELVGKGLDPMVILELIMYATINMIPMGLPLAILLATIMTMGNLGENYELLAMKSAGMSLQRIMAPLMVVATLFSIGSFFVANNYVPFANQQMVSILYDIRQQKQELEFKDGTFFNGIDDMSIRVEHQDPETKLLYDVIIYDNRDKKGDMSVTLADSGYIRLSDDKKFLLITLYHGETYEEDYVKAYLRDGAQRLSYDLYPLLIEDDGSISQQKEFLYNLEFCAEAATFRKRQYAGCSSNTAITDNHGAVMQSSLGEKYI